MIIFIDKISKEEHIEHLIITLSFLKKKQLYVKFKKCESRLEKIALLLHNISKKGILMDLTSVEAVSSWPNPIIITEIKSFSRMASYYICVIERLSKIASPLTQLTCKNIKFK